MKKAVLFIAIYLIAFQTASSQPASSKTASPRQLKNMVSVTQKFLNSLSDSLRAKATYPFESEERFNWHFVPRARNGAPYKQMNPQQRQAAMAMLQTALSAQGYAKSQAIMELESVLKILEGRAPSDNYRDPENYYFTVFGNPSGKTPWGWRVEGHHLSLNFSSLTYEIISNTPAFWGSNPAIVPSGPQKGKQILKQEEELARQLMQSFSPDQLKAVMVETTAPGDIITGNSRKASLEADNGLALSQMNASQKKIFMELLHTYINNFHEELAANHMKKLKKAGMDNLRFAWAGSMERGKGHYYRIKGPTLLIEYDNTQNNANHVHTVVRDLTNDFGEDVLRMHYEQQPHRN